MSHSQSTIPSPKAKPTSPAVGGVDKQAMLKDVEARTGRTLKSHSRGTAKTTDKPTAKAESPQYQAAIKTLGVIDAAQTKVAADILRGAGETISVSDFRTINNADERYAKATAFADALNQVGTVYAMYEGVGADVKDPAEQTDLTIKLNIQRSRLRENGLPTGYVCGDPWAQSIIEELKPFTEGKDATENQRLRDSFKAAAPTQASKNAAATAGTALRDAATKYLVRGADRYSVFLDAGRGSVAMSNEDREQVNAANKRIVQLGRDILNNGGTYDQVQTLMKSTGLSDDQWPPELVQSVQAWRKATRALTAERARSLLKPAKAEFKVDGETVASTTETLATLAEIGADGSELAETLVSIEEAIQKAAEMAEKAKAAAAGVTDAASATGEAASTGAEAASAAGEAAKAISATAWVNGIASGVDGLVGIAQMLQAAYEFYETATDNEMPAREKALKLLGSSIEAIAAATRTAKDGMQMAKDFGGPAIEELMKKVVPGLNIAVASMELAKSSKELAENAVQLNRASAVKRDALASFVGDDGDEAAVNVFGNDKRAAKIAVAKSSVETGANVVELSGSIAGTAGGAHGIAAGAALSIAAGAIKLGGNVIFAGIDWAAATKAMEVLKEAQAGSYEAQVEVFDASNFYAKMYLAIMVKENNPAAKKYLINRGIIQEDLDGPTSLAILRDEMLETASQSNDLDVDDTIVGKMMGFAGDARDGLKNLSADDLLKGSAIFLLAGGVLAPVTLTLADFAEKAATPLYDPDATYDFGVFPATSIAAWADTWEKVKENHVKHGLLDRSTGLRGALTQVVAANNALPAKNPTERDGMDATRKLLLAAIAAMEGIVALTRTVKFQAFAAGILPKKTGHAQAYKTMALLRTGANEALTIFWTRYDGLWPGYATGEPGVKDRVGYEKGDENKPAAVGQWKALPIKSIEVKAWQDFWSDGQKHVGWQDADGGVTKSLTAALKIGTAFADAKETKAKRQRAMEYIAALDEVDDAAGAALTIVNANVRPTAVKAIEDFMLLLNAERRKLDDVLADRNQQTWASPARAFDAIKVADYEGEWNKVWKYATAEAFSAGSDDNGLGKALADFASDFAVVNATTSDSKQRLRATRSMEVNAGRVKMSAIEFARKQRYAAEPLKAYADLVRSEVVRITKDVVDMDNIRTSSIDFDHEPKKEPKYLSSFEWRRVAGDAVEKGAVLESKTATGTLANALKNQKKAREEYQSKDTKTAKDDKRGKMMRPPAEAYEKALQTTLGATMMTLGLKRYDKNKLMAGYLNGVIGAVEVQLADPKLEGLLDGSSSAPRDLTFARAKLDTKTWSDQKEIAVKYGIIPSTDTGMRKAIEAVNKSKGEDRAKRLKELGELLRKLRATSKNPAWNKFLDDLGAASP